MGHAVVRTLCPQWGHKGTLLKPSRCGRAAYFTCISACQRKIVWNMIPRDALQIRGSARQITLGIVTKVYFPLGDSDLTTASRVNQAGRTEMVSLERWWELALWLWGLARQG